MSDSLATPRTTRLLCPWNSLGKNTGVGCHFLLQGIFPTLGLNPYLLHWQADSLPQSHQRSLQKIALKHLPHFPFICLCLAKPNSTFSSACRPACSMVLSCLTLQEPRDYSLTCSFRLPWQEYWGGLPFPPPGALPNPKIELMHEAPALAGRFFSTEPSGKPCLLINI